MKNSMRVLLLLISFNAHGMSKYVSKAADLCVDVGAVVLNGAHRINQNTGLLVNRDKEAAAAVGVLAATTLLLATKDILGRTISVAVVAGLMFVCAAGKGAIL